MELRIPLRKVGPIQCKAFSINMRFGCPYVVKQPPKIANEPCSSILSPHGIGLTVIVDNLKY